MLVKKLNSANSKLRSKVAIQTPAARILLCLALFSVMFLHPPTACAIPDLCFGDPVVCRGDQSGGVSFSPPPPLIMVTPSTSIKPASGTPGIDLEGQGKNGAKGGFRSYGIWGKGKKGGDGSAGFPVDLTSTATISTQNGQAIAVYSLGGKGGTGGSSAGLTYVIGGKGGAGGDGEDISITSSGAVSTSGDNGQGIYAFSRAGDGGKGGDGYGVYGKGGDGGPGGTGGSVIIASDNTEIATDGFNAHAIFAQSLGGFGGNGGAGGGIFGGGGAGSSTGKGGEVTVTSEGVIETWGLNSDGILAQSIGGYGGSGGSGGGLVGYGGSARSSGDGGTVHVTVTDSIRTHEEYSDAILAQSIGGGGGSAGSGGGLVGLGGTGNAGGHGGSVTVTNSGELQTSGTASSGIFAQSIGGGGGDGGSSGGLVAIGGKGGDTSNGGAVTVANIGSIRTEGVGSQAIFAQSIGGGGGNGGASGGWFSVGGRGGGGGNSGAVTVNHSGLLLSTSQADSSAIFAQSIGGGGGNGGGSGSIGAFASLAIGGGGGKGGSAAEVDVNSSAGSIAVGGDRSHGILAQSVGGGGGNGGFAISGSISPYASLGIGVGGTGGNGGSGNTVDVQSESNISTSGRDAHGIFTQSIGGGGGSGGFSIAVSASTGASGAFAIGGSGGGGGGAADVTVGTGVGSTITTSGEHAYGIAAQSVGGGGGDGGFSIAGSFGKAASLSFGLGGSGGIGGAGSTVDLLSGSDIITAGDNSYGILAQSIGGGGGSGGFSVSASFALEGGTLGIGVGGAAGAGNSSGAVSLESSGDVHTMGDVSHGIVAQSIGGSGGAGGFAGSISGTFKKGASLNASIGGRGGAGGNAGRVEVETGTAMPNEKNITTEGEGAFGILAQSIGGGGGDGGFGLTVALGTGQESVNVALALGGKGGAGGTGETVDVMNNASVATLGNTSHGIVAQSIGGGGGNGGFSASGTIGVGTNSKDFALSIGGGGGAGNTAGEVTVTSAGGIWTEGLSSSGILAQSIGGGGGNGGLGFSGSFGSSDSKNLAVAIGGNGGTGGTAGIVEVANSGVIHTLGGSSHGIMAQSLGGSGGSGGSSISAGFGVGGEGKNLNLGVSVGGTGGSGGAGNAVEVASSAEITTEGTNSQGIFAQSVGGGGGDGGASITTLASFYPTGSKGNSVNLTFAVGGSGGSGNDGGAVVVENSGAVTTMKDSSAGIFAQSIGGGGGVGGRANAVSVVFGAECTIPILCDGSQDNSKNNLSLSLAIGGNGGGSGSGGAVSVANKGKIVTWSPESDGIFAQSVGGGGGTGGNGVLGSGELLPIPVELAFVPVGKVKFYKDISVAVGGTGGSSGDGGRVAVINTADLTTHGDHSSGIFAQSVGGGGGKGGNAVIGLMGKIGLGGAAGTSGNGGDANVDHMGRIETFGVGGDGIFAQSVGGGGGKAGNVDRGILKAGIGVAFGRGGGNGGNGGIVAVKSAGEIVTHNEGANGIFAQSVGGGGGVAGDIGHGIGFAGSTGGSGSGGAVSVSHTGSITTDGRTSHGIFAQSAGGSNSGDTVRITVNGGIRAQGQDSHGIFAQSVGTGGQGNISIAIAGGTVQGGSGSGTGVRIEDGSANLLTNRGTIGALGGLAGRAVSGTTGAETIDNFGTITGLVDLGVGRNAFNNHEPGLFNMGSTVTLGSGNLLTNDGILAPGGKGAVLTTALTGDLRQTSSGTYAVDVDLANITADRINVSGASDLGGHAEINLLNKRWAKAGAEEVTILSSRGGVTYSGIGLAYRQAAIISYDLLFPTAKDVALGFSIDFAPIGLTKSQRAMGSFISSIQDAGSSPGVGLLVEQLFSLPDLKTLGAAYDSIFPYAYEADTLSTLAITRFYQRTLQHRMQWLRPSLWGENETAALFTTKPVYLAFADPNSQLGQFQPPATRQKRAGFWLDGFSQFGNSSVEGFKDFSFGMAGGNAGFDYAFTDRLLAGVNVAYANANVDLSGNWGHGDIQTFFGSLYGTYFTDRAYVEGVFSYGRHWYHNHHFVDIGDIHLNPDGSHHGNSFSSLVEGGYTFRPQGFAIQPFASLSHIYLDEGRVTESGANPLNMTIGSRQTNSLNSELGVRVARPVETTQGVLLPEIGAAWRHDFKIDKQTIRGAFADRPDIGFVVDSRKVGADSAVINAGVAFITKHGVTVSVQYDADLGSGFTSHGVSGQIRLSF